VHSCVLQTPLDPPDGFGAQEGKQKRQAREYLRLLLVHSSA